jgi:integrase
VSPRRRTRDTDLPACVYRRHGAYWLVKRGKWRRLGADLRTALAAYAAIVETPGDGAMVQLIEEAMTEVIEPSVRPETRKAYRRVAQRLKRTFAEFNPEQVTAADIAALRRSMRETPGMWNHTVTLLRRIFDYALEEQLVKSNPAHEVKRLRQSPRKRRLSSEEYQRIYGFASPRLQVLMDLMFACGQRPMDVVRLKRMEFKPEGIAFEQSKTGKRLIVQWTTELRAVAERAKGLYGSKVESMTIFRTRWGRVPSYGTIHGMWRAACVKAGILDAQLRDLRAMSASEAKREGLDATALLGHSSPRTTAIYLRDKDVPVVEGPSLKKVRLADK